MLTFIRARGHTLRKNRLSVPLPKTSKSCEAKTNKIPVKRLSCGSGVGLNCHAQPIWKVSWPPKVGLQGAVPTC